MGKFCVAILFGLGVGSCASATTGDAPRPAHEIVSGGARVRGGGIRMDVQVGHVFGQEPVTGGKVAVKPAAVVAP